MHADHDVVHRRERCIVRLDHDAQALVDLGEIGFGDDDGDLDDFVRLRIETGHLEVDPHHPAIGCLRGGGTCIITHTDTLGQMGARTQWT